jgi:hypothetical protein
LAATAIDGAMSTIVALKTTAPSSARARSDIELAPMKTPN